MHEIIIRPPRSVTNVSIFLPIIYTIKQMQKEKERFNWLTSTVRPFSSTTFLFLKSRKQEISKRTFQFCALKKNHWQVEQCQIQIKSKRISIETEIEN